MARYDSPCLSQFDAFFMSVTSQIGAGQVIFRSSFRTPSAGDPLCPGTPVRTLPLTEGSLMNAHSPVGHFSVSIPDRPVGFTRRCMLAGAAWATPVILTATAAPLAAASTCQSASGLYNTRAGARLLHGSLAGISLNAVTGLAGAQANNAAGSPPLVTMAGPATLAPLAGPAAVLSGVLTLAATASGVANQYAEANQNGASLVPSARSPTTAASRWTRTPTSRRTSRASSSRESSRTSQVRPSPTLSARCLAPRLLSAPSGR